MISIHEFKELLVISGFSLCFLYALKKELQENFDKKMLGVYQYSIPFFSGIFITLISLFGCVYSLLCSKYANMVIDVNYHRIFSCDL